MYRSHVISNMTTRREWTIHDADMHHVSQQLNAIEKLLNIFWWGQWVFKVFEVCFPLENPHVLYLTCIPPCCSALWCGISQRSWKDSSLQKTAEEDKVLDVPGSWIFLPTQCIKWIKKSGIIWCHVYLELLYCNQYMTRYCAEVRGFYPLNR